MPAKRAPPPFNQPGVYESGVNIKETPRKLQGMEQQGVIPSFPLFDG